MKWVGSCGGQPQGKRMDCICPQHPHTMGMALLRPGKHFSILCVPRFLVFPLWNHSLRAMTWADVTYLSFSLAVCTKEMVFVIKGACSVIGSCKKISWTLLFLCYLRVSVSHSAARFYLLVTNKTNKKTNSQTKLMSYGFIYSYIHFIYIYIYILYVLQYIKPFF